MLAAAVELAQFPPLENADAHGSARSKTCGSTIAMDLKLAENGTISAIGLKVRACAVGQAAAAIFARHASAKTPAAIAAMSDQIAHWLEQGGEPPDWPDFAMIAPARAYKARHGAIMLPWKAANEALSSTATAR